MEAIVEGQVRRRRGFLWLPKTINHETRWLSHEEWIEVYQKNPFIPFLYSWRELSWL